MKKTALAILAAIVFAAPAGAQQQGAPVIAVPPLSTPDDVATSMGTTTLSVAWQASQLIANDLRSTAEVMALPPEQKDYYSYPEVTAPNFAAWRARGVKALVTGFVRTQGTSKLAVGCYVYDVERGRELGRTGFVADAQDWRRAAHKCSGLAYKEIVGAPGIFDARIAYVATTGAGAAQVKRVAVMDSDGFNHSYVTQGGETVLTPRLSPKGDRLAFVSYLGGLPHVRIIDLPTGEQRPLAPNGLMSFAPRYSPDGTRIVFSMANGANTDIYVVNATGGTPRRLTTSPGSDTSPSYSPDGQKILFESDRSGSQQLYVMNVDGSDQRRVSFGGGTYASPEWSPDGTKIAFTRRGPDGLRIAVMDADGSDVRVLTTGPRDEGPSWAASSRELIFQRTEASGKNGVYRVALSTGAPRKVTIPQDGSDPDWSGVRE